MIPIDEAPKQRLTPTCVSRSGSSMPMEDQFYILATDSSAEEPKRVLKDGETFAVFDLHGDIQPNGPGQQGLYHEGTRFLSHLLFKLGHTRPFLLN
jgi:hypothetical protein